MKIASFVLSVLLISAVLPLPATAQTSPKPEQLAQKSAEAWLALIDSGKYAESWDEAAQFFKDKVAKQQWIDDVKSARSPFGALQSRKLKSANYTKTLPGAPDGQYVVIQFDTSIEHKKSAVETVTPLLDKDGQWRVSGYYIK